MLQNKLTHNSADIYYSRFCFVHRRHAGWRGEQGGREGGRAKGGERGAGGGVGRVGARDK